MDITTIANGVIDLGRSPFVAGPAGTGAGSIITWYFRSYRARITARDQIASAMLDVQRRISTITFDGLGSDIQWAEKKPEWAKTSIFGSWVGRIDDAKGLAETARLGPVVVTLICKYRDSIQIYSDKWFSTRKRALGEDQGFWNSYNATKKDLHQLLRSIKRFDDVKVAVKEGGVLEMDESHIDNKPASNALGYSAQR